MTFLIINYWLNYQKYFKSPKICREAKNSTLEPNLSQTLTQSFKGWHIIMGACILLIPHNVSWKEKQQVVHIIYSDNTWFYSWYSNLKQAYKGTVCGLPIICQLHPYSLFTSANFTKCLSKNFDVVSIQIGRFPFQKLEILQIH